ncbi:hypothetical protein HMPREF9565_01631 [Cutibacterium acnes HL053PA2]|nr:hypothetical protein HMPREF9575_01853 [Cutibacterium acnes HL110PA1]EFS42885.1 hypothetical protein HMPREF9576_01977 [Cutibacterium acnes HL110PA2]EFT06626.1 hypothetical protein HMPREF9618_01848 [Cutibacterium acnes HL082PA1]EFT49793.1 hypothetical protein HMPREF9565_01631 [Cutibacterium acnes HL053PA2]EGF00063.1 hypothetical protein HMPREF9584_01840 [Cutibacterium acnes HL092PA1]
MYRRVAAGKPPTYNDPPATTAGGSFSKATPTGATPPRYPPHPCQDPTTPTSAPFVTSSRLDPIKTPRKR